MSNWYIDHRDVRAPRHPEALTDPVSLLEILIAAFRAPEIARMLDTTPKILATWRTREHVPPAEYARRIQDLHTVLTYALRAFHPQTVPDWLLGTEPFLGPGPAGARPIDVLSYGRVSELLGAIDANEKGGYA